MRHLYNTALTAIRPLVGLWGAWPHRRRETAERWRQRTVREVPAACPGARWLHGSSVGEARLVNAVATQLRRRAPRDPVAVSAFTATGRAALTGPPLTDRVFYLPLDIPGYPARLIGALRPRSLTLLETEIWPNLIRACAGGGVPVAVVNGRLSPDRMARYRRFAGLYRPVLAALQAVGAQSQEDAARFEELGVSGHRIVVTGNLKHDLPPAPSGPAAWRGRLGLTQQPVWVAGSTAEGEDEFVLRAFLEVRRSVPDLVLVLAPRHPRRCAAVADLVERAGLALRNLSSASPAGATPDVWLVDTLGDLGALYGVATVAFVGGSLVPVGGHNLLEPAQLAVPVLFGPHVDHVAAMARELLDCGGGIQVAGAAELAETMSGLLRDGARRARLGGQARAMVEANRGALDRSVDLVLRLELRG